MTEIVNLARLDVGRTMLCRRAQSGTPARTRTWNLEVGDLVLYAVDDAGQELSPLPATVLRTV